jgi:Domain of unknown function DUF29
LADDTPVKSGLENDTVTPTLYDINFYAWTQAQAADLRANKWHQMDLEHLAEEIESVGKWDRRTVQSHLHIPLAYLLKWRYPPPRRRRSWQPSLLNTWTEIAQHLKRQHHLQQVLGYGRVAGGLNP